MGPGAVVAEGAEERSQCQENCAVIVHESEILGNMRRTEPEMALVGGGGELGKVLAGDNTHCDWYWEGMNSGAKRSSDSGRPYETEFVRRRCRLFGPPLYSERPRVNTLRKVSEMVSARTAAVVVTALSTPRSMGEDWQRGTCCHLHQGP